MSRAFRPGARTIALALVFLASCTAGDRAEVTSRVEATAPPAAPSTTAAPAMPPPPVPPTAIPEAPASQPEAAAVAAKSPKPAPPPPSVPRNLRATARSSSEVALAWEAGEGSAPGITFEVFRGTDLLGPAPGARFVVTGLRAGTSTCYSVRAIDGGGRRSERTRPACCTTLDTTPPTVPARVTVTAELHDVAVVTWDASTDDVGVVAYEVSHSGKRIEKINATRLADEGLSPLKEYCYTVRALDAAGNRSPSSPPACVTIPDTRPPTVPAQVRAEARDEHVIALSWGPSRDDVGVARYDVVEVDASAGAPVATTTASASLSGFAAATRHCFSVRACDAAGNCSEPATAACATTPDLTPPTTPAPLAEVKSDEAIEVRWKASTDNVGVAGYEVFRGDFHVGRTDAATLAFTDAGLHPTVEYCYRIEAHDAAGNRSKPSSPVCARPPDLKPPTTPGRPAALPVSSSQLYVAWDPSTDDVGVVAYELAREGAVLLRLTGTRARDKGLAPSRSYCYTVRALDGAGNRSQPAGPFCATTSQLGSLAAPSDLRVRRVSASNVLLEWGPSEQKGVTYVVYASGSGRVGLVGRTNANTFTPSGSLGAKPDCYRVAAVDGAGRESPQSNEICAAAKSAVTTR